jgi:hypothetical protein
MWHGPLFVSRRRDIDLVVLKEDVEFVPSYVYNEREILVETLEKWLDELKEEKCENPFCFCQ